MSPVVSVKRLRKYFKVYKKEPGLLGSVKSLFSRDYSEIQAVNDISFEIQKGEFVGFIGPNGAGKTTTLKCLSGLLYPTSGEVGVLGHTPWHRERSFLKKISLVMGQKNQLWWDLPAYDSFLLNKEIYEVDEQDFKNKIDELIDLLSLGRVVNIPVRKLSLGQRMKCELVSALLHAPSVVFLDEPTIGLDVVMQRRLRNFFKEYNQKFGTTVILTSHNMDDVKELCKRVIIVDGGHIMYDGKISDLIREHVKYKTISFVVSKKIDRADLEKIGQVVSLNDTGGVIHVDRNDVANASAKLLKAFPVEDLDIAEMSLEGVIRQIFTNE
ncbi:ATP-binding cassette domain-containing protein [bacterium]|nr:ATP-binding cassette domain-containing protein [bacterium]